MQIRIYLFAIVAVYLYAQCTETVTEPVTNQLVDTADQAMVVTAHPLASMAALEVMKEGGNAVDAAITAQFTLAVVYPRAGNIGGGGFMIWRDSSGEANSLDFRETAPRSATQRMYQDSLGNVQHSLSLKGPLASGVPGTVEGMYAAFEKYSKLKDWKRLLQPAIDYAKNGFLIDSAEADRLNYYRDQFLEYNTSTQCPFIKETPWKAGDRLVQTDLARTLKRIQNERADGFYKGETAEYIIDRMKKKGGLIDKQDLSSYTAVWRNPIVTSYKECTMISMPPPSSGGIALGQLLKSIELLGLDGKSLYDSTVARKIIESERRVYADRAKYLGDPDFVEVPVNMLLDTAYLKERLASIDLSRPTKSSAVQADSFPIRRESFETTHLSIIDPCGNAVSLTTTINSNYGSKVWVPGAGFFLNNEMDDFSAKPGVPNQFGLVGSDANAIAPGKRMLSSMTPTIFEKNGEPYLVIGSPGGSTIITSVFQVFLWLEEMGYPVNKSIKKGRYHHQWLPESVFFERELVPDSFTRSLVNSGYVLDTFMHIGLVKAIHVDSTGLLVGSGDPRSRDDARGY